MMSSSDSDQEEPSMPALTYALVLFAADRSFDLVLKTWFKSPTTVLWPPRRAYEKAIDGRIAPDENWTLHEVIVLAQHDSWRSALKLRSRYENKGDVVSTDCEVSRHRPPADVFIDRHSNCLDEEIEYSRNRKSRSRLPAGEPTVVPKAPRLQTVLQQSHASNIRPGPNSNNSATSVITAPCGILSARAAAMPSSAGAAAVSSSAGAAAMPSSAGAAAISSPANRNRSALPSAVSSPGLRNSPSVELSPFAAANTQSLLVTLGDLYGEQPDVASPGQSSTVTLAEVASMISKIEASQRATYLKVCSIDRRLQSIEQHISSNPLPAAHSAADSRQHQIPTDKAILGGLPFNSPEGLLAWSRQVKEDRKSTETVFAFLRRLGGKSVSTQVSTLMYQLMTDGLAKQYSLRGAVRRGVSKLPFENLGLLPLIKNVVWTAHKTATGLAIEEAVGEHLRFAAVRERRKAERASSGQNAADSGVGPRLDGEGDAEGFGADDADEEDNY
ncbi:hypothetical protein BOX15_Mlig018882g1 [Macrostomum lignano]|uniref:DUF4806 domain-containing protein n=1 Tax=Macrostomum lignano TaxID=282301 RepID=A0A267F4I4_9PLAT|nr:hypothetical protein BOX15_Mlig018882g3 [Macrostomum lignano]PAA68685.1 hypothetical protein BOX15_Mlig018882g1 [Macrostomum lignano]